MNVIKNFDGEYWSNDYGWADFIYATGFTDAERETFSLPMGGRWVSIDPMPSPFCRHRFKSPNPCAGKGYCPMDPACND